MSLLNGSSPYLKGHAGLLVKVRRPSLHPVLGLLELVQTQHNVSNIQKFSVVQVHSFFIKNVSKNAKSSSYDFSSFKHISLLSLTTASQ